jgi:hypothetical protein
VGVRLDLGVGRERDTSGGPLSKTVTYFIARGRSLEIIEAYLTGIEDHLTHTNEMAKRLGADGTYRREGRQCVGFAFTKEKDIPKGLRRNKTDFEMCVPDRRIKEGQALENEMNSKPCPTTSWVLRRTSDSTPLVGACPLASSPSRR